jgi:predicted nucleic acid-binding protein
MTMSPDGALLDTNILVYALYEEAEHHKACRYLLDQAQDAEAALYVTPQVLAKFFSTVTNPRRVTEAKSPEEVISVITAILAMPSMTLLPIPIDLVSRWIALVQQHPITGSRIFDVQIVATMLGNEVKRVYTYNTADFMGFDDEIEVLRPEPPPLASDDTSL